MVISIVVIIIAAIVARVVLVVLIGGSSPRQLDRIVYSACPEGDSARAAQHPLRQDTPPANEGILQDTRNAHEIRTQLGIRVLQIGTLRAA